MPADTPSRAGDALSQARAIARALRDERRAPGQVRERQDRALRAMVRYAARHSPFYRDLFRRAGTDPTDVVTVADLPLIPITTKSDVQRAGPDRMLADGHTRNGSIPEKTSGSSGRVLQLYHSRSAYDRYVAFGFRHLTAIGYRPWHRVAYTAFEPLPALPWHRWGLGRRDLIDLAAGDPRRYVQDLLRIRPHVITSYPSILQLVINTATTGELARIRPRAVHLHSELLTDNLRGQIRSAFGCDCYDDYSTAEFHHIGYECPQHRYHLAGDNVVVEFVRDGRPVAPGEEGEILVTGLSNRAMPLLRYAIGDVGVPDAAPPDGSSPCPCGRGFPTLRMVAGRIDDFVVLPSGRRFSPRMINPVYENLPGVMEHMLVQEEPGHLVAQVAIAPEHRGSTPALIHRALEALFVEPLRIDVQVTAVLPRGRTGKLRTVMSKVRDPLQNYLA